jgi:membrane-bound lytic murein transglycosylase B
VGRRSRDGTALPALSQAAWLLPTGSCGPAFMIGPNFRAVLRCNNATRCAPAVGPLAQRIGGIGIPPARATPDRRHDSVP